MQQVMIGSLTQVLLRLLSAWLLVSMVGCGNNSGSGEFYTHWDIAGGCASDEGGDTRPSGAGTQVDVCDDVGKYPWIWVSYAAPWCSASKAQAPHIRALLRGAGSDLSIYTVLTSSHEPFSAATANDARAWSNAYGLPARQVLAEEATRTIPQHLLIGPDGRTFYRYVGFLRTEEIQQILDDFSNYTRMPDVRSLPRP